MGSNMKSTNPWHSSLDPVNRPQHTGHILNWRLLQNWSEGRINDQEYDRIQEMIDSSDPGNLTMAELLINQTWLRESQLNHSERKD